MIKYENAYYQVQKLVRKRYLQKMLRVFDESRIERSRLAEMALIA
jgi:hypothetical protein